MELIIKEYGDIIIAVLCLTLAVSFISLFVTKCEYIESTLLSVLFYH